MKFSYMPGCSLSTASKEYDISLRSVLRQLGIEVEELKDWSCCGASPAHNKSENLAITLAGRNLGLADSLGLDVLAPCVGCYISLKHAHIKLSQNADLKERLNKIVDNKVTLQSKVLHPLDLLKDFDFTSKIKRPLNDLKVAVYYGCFVRPEKEMNFGNSEWPVIMDNIISKTSAQICDWAFKTECCGASLAATKPEIAQNLCAQILRHAKFAGADVIVTACPLCQQNLDMRQTKIDNKDESTIPILYFSQLIGLALDMKDEDLCINSHFVDPKPALAKVRSSNG